GADTPRTVRAYAWSPASAGATRVGITSSRTTVRFECGEPQTPCRPGVGRDPGKEAARHARMAWTPASAGATKVGGTSSRTTVRFELGEIQIHCRPGVGRDPGRKAARVGVRMSGLRPPPGRRR